MNNIFFNNYLMLDTACPRAIVGVLKNGTVESEVVLDELMKHGEQLSGAIQTALNQANITMSDLHGIIVGNGPGSFVGLRVSIATAKGLCMAREIPLFSVSTLLALGSEPTLPEGTGYALIDARRSEFYFQKICRKFIGDELVSAALGDPGAMSPEDLEPLLRKSDFIAGFGTDINLTASGIAKAFSARQQLVDETFTLVPAYCRKPDATLPRVMVDRFVAK